jgi:hypothetical protein
VNYHSGGDKLPRFPRSGSKIFGVCAVEQLMLKQRKNILCDGPDLS